MKRLDCYNWYNWKQVPYKSMHGTGTLYGTRVLQRTAPYSPLCGNLKIKIKSTARPVVMTTDNVMRCWVRREEFVDGGEDADADRQETVSRQCMCMCMCITGLMRLSTLGADDEDASRGPRGGTMGRLIGEQEQEQEQGIIALQSLVCTCLHVFVQQK